MTCAPWPTAPCCDIEPSASNLQAATDVLYALSGRQYPGLCQETIRPCSNSTGFPRSWPYPYYPQFYNGVWHNFGCGCHVSYDCGCKGIPQVDLGRNDVVEIFRVNIDGTDLSASSYRLDEGRWLVRTDGSQWPCCQDLTKDIGESGAWYIELEHGTDPPELGQLAVSNLACELQKACDNDPSCALPARVTSVVREGVTLALIDPQEFLTDGRTGLYVVDLFLKAYNPQGIARRATAWSPGLPGRARRVGSLNS